jgi:predicted amidohydrolase
MLEKDEDKYYQTGVLIGRSGEIIGKYRKTHIPLSEAEYGYTPGSEYPVFDTDFGKIGIMICWDHWFPEPARILRSKGAEIIFLPTQGNAQIQEQARAVDNSVYLVVSGYVDPKNSKIINPLGQVIKTVSKPHSYAVEEIDLDQRFYQNWLSVGPCDGEGRSVYIKERRVETYKELLGE